jgi:hypothetical protein
VAAQLDGDRCTDRRRIESVAKLRVRLDDEGTGVGHARPVTQRP